MPGISGEWEFPLMAARLPVLAVLAVVLTIPEELVELHSKRVLNQNPKIGLQMVNKAETVK